VNRSPVRATINKLDSHAGSGRRFAVTASTGTLDRDQDRIPPDAWDLTHYRQNPVVFANHQSQSLPVGRALNPRIDNGRLVTTIEFPPAGVSAAADEVHDLVASGFLRGVSVGFKPVGPALLNEYGGRDYTRAELLEISLVGIPSNADSLVLGPAKGLALVEQAALATVTRALKGPTGYGDAVGPDHSRGTGDPTRDVQGCVMAGLCPKRVNSPCPAAEGCPMGKSLSPEQRVERRRRMEATIKGWSERFAIHRRAVEAQAWARVKAAVLAVDPKDRPLLRPGEVPRDIEDRMPADVKAVVFAPNPGPQGYGIEWV